MVFENIRNLREDNDKTQHVGCPTPEKPVFLHEKIGVTGFEPAASTSRT